MHRHVYFALALAAVVCANPQRLLAEKTQARSSGTPVRIGAVAYSPGVVTVFKNLRRYLNRNDFPSDYVLYSNYDSLVQALSHGEVDIAWNTPLAHAQFHVQNALSSQTLVMRDVDREIRSVLVARVDSGIERLADLAGKKLVIGSARAAEATVLPLHYLEREEVDLGEIRVIDLDKEVDSQGNPCSSPQHVLQAIRSGRGDAGVITERLWERVEAAPSGGQPLKRVWTSPSFSHCVFTASSEFEPGLAQRFTELMTGMDPADPTCSEVMRLEGTKQWLPASQEGFHDLIQALRKD